MGKVTSIEQTPIANEIKKTCFNVNKEISKQWEVCEIFDNFFEVRTHEKFMKNNGFLLVKFLK